MKQSFLGVLCFCIAFSIHAQSLLTPATGYLAAGTYSAGFADVFSFTVNQASLAKMKNTSVGLFNEKKFLLPGLDNYLVAAGIVTSPGNFGIKMNYAGSGPYNEMQLGLAHARKLGKNMEAGVQFNYSNIHIAGYGTSSIIGFEIGSLFQVTRVLHAGIHVANPAGGKFGKNRREKLPSVYRMGLAYEPSGIVLINAEIVKEEDQPVNINTGVVYRVIPQLLISAGIMTMTSSPWISFGFLWKAYRMGLSASYHPQLGFCPGLSLVFDFKSKEKTESN